MLAQNQTHPGLCTFRHNIEIWISFQVYAYDIVSNVKLGIGSGRPSAGALRWKWTRSSKTALSAERRLSMAETTPAAAAR